MKGLHKGEWNLIADNGSQKLWDVIMGDGSTHEVVTATWLGEDFIIEVDGVTVKHSLDRNGHNIYSLEAMDIKNALEKTRAKWQPKDSDCPHADNITHDTAEVKSIAGLWRMIKSA